MPTLNPSSSTNLNFRTCITQSYPEQISTNTNNINKNTMDFAAILASEISKKRKDTPNIATATADVPPAKKYLKRSELEAQRQAEYQRKQQELNAQRTAKSEEKLRQEAHAAARREESREKQQRLADERRAKREEDEKQKLIEAEKKKKIDGNGKDGGDLDKEEREMTDGEAIAKLREMGYPARLFGESTVGRLKRCRRIMATREAKEMEKEIDLAPLLNEEEMRIDLEKIKMEPELVYRQLDSWFRLVMLEWRKALDERPLAVKESFLGKKAADAMLQADEYMKPLFKHFRQRDLRPNVFEKVCEIVVEAQQRRYVKANDVYLKLSIGNA
jgi:pre-mRNA-splicing factor 18